MLDIVKEVLEDLDALSRMLKKGNDWGGQEFLMFRGGWFDAKHGVSYFLLIYFMTHQLNPRSQKTILEKAFTTDLGGMAGRE